MRKKLLFASAIIIVLQSCNNSKSKPSVENFIGSWESIGKADTAEMIIKKLGNEIVVKDKSNSELKPAKYDGQKNSLTVYFKSYFQTDTVEINYIRESDELVIKTSDKQREFERVN
ncbi:MAG: hypothetical protein V4560_03050 [Bacteroidota bacterium]